MSHDIQLEEAVIAELGWEPSVVAPYIGVAASDGAVTLTGHVGTYMEKHGAEAAARRVRGVKAVIDEIEVRLQSEHIRGDIEIGQAAVHSLASDVAVPEGAVKVTVDKGWRRRMAFSERGRGTGYPTAVRRRRRHQRHRDRPQGRRVDYQRRHHPCPASILVLRSQDNRRLR